MGKTYRLQTSNAIVYEDLSNVNDSIFENVYKSADRTLAKIIEDNAKNAEDNEQVGNVISFLGGRGRGKTSAMLSFVRKLECLKTYEWSEIRNIKDVEIGFLDLPPIDAAMLAEQEFIIDAVLAEMWDKFERELQNDSGYTNDMPYGKAKEKELKQLFVDTRYAYIVSQEHETQGNRGTLDDLPTAGALHGLAASINLRQQMIKLVQHYLDFWGNQPRRGNCYNSKFQAYLVIAIDDIDMSGGKAHYILEQIRRYLSIPNVIVMVTADIDRLQKSCETRYEKIYKDEGDRQQIISDYLEKVLPYNMRVHLPELNENHGQIQIITPANEKLDIKSNNEKDFILEFMMKKCELYFDPTRRKRHFLQNYTMRSMVNYFEQLIRLNGISYNSWLKTDIKERLIERISDREQKLFVEKLLTKDYEVMNDVVLGYIRKKLDDPGIVVKNGGLGQVLYGCNLLENQSEENAEFVDCIIMLYSVILKSVDNELKKKIWGNSLFGNWEYNIVQDTGSELISGFSEKAKLQLKISVSDRNKMKKANGRWAALTEIIKKNRVQIEAWMATLLFVTIVQGLNGEIAFEAELKEEKENQKGEIGVPSATNLNTTSSNGSTEAAKDESISEEKVIGYEVEIKPSFFARKNFLSCCYDETKYNQVLCQCMKNLLNGLLSSLEIEEKVTDEKTEEILKSYFKLYNNENNCEKKKENIGVYTSAVEVVYAIGRATNQVSLLKNNDEKECYNILMMKYRYIYKKLQKIDNYYDEISSETKTGFAENFRNSIQAEILLDDKFLDSDTGEAFKSMMEKLLLEAKRSTSILSDPGR